MVSTLRRYDGPQKDEICIEDWVNLHHTAFISFPCAFNFFSFFLITSLFISGFFSTWSLQFICIFFQLLYEYHWNRVPWLSLIAFSDISLVCSMHNLWFHVSVMGAIINPQKDIPINTCFTRCAKVHDIVYVRAYSAKAPSLQAFLTKLMCKTVSPTTSTGYLLCPIGMNPNGNFTLSHFVLRQLCYLATLLWGTTLFFGHSAHTIHLIEPCNPASWAP